MADGAVSGLGSYVKLTKAHASLQDVKPGELNQPMDVAQVNARRCLECGQYLPPSYQPPADEDWSSGVCGCAEDPESCKTGLFCPCLLFGHNIEKMNDEIPWNIACLCHALCVEGGMALAAVTATFNGIDPDTAFLITEGLLFAWWMCGIYTGMARQTLQRRYHLKDAPCDPCMVHCCLHWCALCQEHREMKVRLVDNSDEKTVVEPPPLQQMKAEANNEHASESSTGKEIVAVAGRRSV